ncbi:hypothetical protein CANARDRAFT_26275 [[Candida] arabinofermentans NRRL YB-2248]|uniref:ferric-chelate reductase (NADPH) n=1 Tax=[Candida] arabinofermentans NRRL YB-2248 TaxID=983967 RepID=A0A1E4T8N7_9ASCO|nr:hypothetical protein CANARDRAFT_26275 [[Candida] arabinofermentans NRRL YB-2248]
MKAYKCRCPNVDWLGSIANCIYENGNSTKEIHHAYKHVATRCLQKAQLHYSVKDFENWQQNATKYIEPVAKDDYTTVITHPVEVDIEAYRPYYIGFRDWNRWISLCSRLGWGLVGFWFGIMGVTGILHYSHIVPNLREKLVPKRFKQFVYKYLTIPKVPFSGGLTRMEFFISSLFIILTVLSCSINYTLDVSVYMNSQYFLTLDQVSFRVDLLAFSLMPVVYLLGLRNNPLQYLTGLPHSVMIKYHKVTCLVFVILAMIHSIIWTVDACKEGGYKSWVEWYWSWGIAATTIACLMIAQSLKFIRDAMYETFLIVHQLFAIMLIVSVWFHCASLGWMGWVYSMAASLSWDRLCRIVRILVNGGINSAKIESFNETVLKLEFSKPKCYKFYSGSYVYLHFLSPWYLCWQSHPFSLIESIEDKGKLVVYLKCKRGITKQLAKTVDSCSGSTKILIDGPYGCFPLPQLQDKEIPKIICVAGGLGISSLLPILQKSELELANHRLIWMINDLTYISWMKVTMDELAKRGLVIDIYFTKGSATDGSAIMSYILGTDSSQTDIKDEESEGKKGQYRVHYGKPDLDNLLVMELNSDKKDTKIYCCGPGVMNDQVRKTICKQINLKSERSVELTIENHEW